MKWMTIILVLLLMGLALGQNKLYIWKNNTVTDSIAITSDLKITFRGQALAPAQFSDNFNDSNFANNPHWDYYPIIVGCTPVGTVEVLNGAFHVLKTGSNSCGTGTFIEHALDMDIADSAKITFDINPVFSDVGGGAGYTSEEYPAYVDIRVKDAKGDSSDVRFCYNYRGGTSHTNSATKIMFVVFPNVSQNVWLRNQVFKIKAYAPTAVKIIRVLMGGNGWNYECYVDNIVISNQ